MPERSAPTSAGTQTTTPGAPPPAAPPAPPAASSGAGDQGTAVRPGFAERLQAKLSATTERSPSGTSGTSGTGSTSTTSTSKAPARGRTPRRARLRLTRVDPWSVMKASFLLSIAFGIVTVVAVAMIWQVLGAAGVWDSINQTIKDTLDSKDTNNFDIQNYVGTSRVLGFTMLVSAVDVVLLTAIATLGAFLYNMSAALLGGIEVTLAEDE